MAHVPSPRHGIIQAGILVASLFVGAIAVFGFLVVPGTMIRSAEMRIEPLSKRVTVGEEFTVSVVVDSAIPINAFEGYLRFTEGTLEVIGHSLENSVVDLWIALPQFFNDRGVITFTGGTTAPGGFIGKGTIISITFRAKEVGDAALFIEKATILQHDGHGSDAPIAELVKAEYIIEQLATAPEKNVVTQSSIAATYNISPEPPPSPDLNGDGLYSIRDVSILMRHMLGYDERYDFNRDNEVNIGDLSILLEKIRG